MFDESSFGQLKNIDAYFHIFKKQERWYEVLVYEVWQ